LDIKICEPLIYGMSASAEMTFLSAAEEFA